MVEGGAVGDAVGLAGKQRADGKRDVLRRGVCAKPANGSQHVVSAADAVDQSGGEKPVQGVPDGLG